MKHASRDDFSTPESSPSTPSAVCATAASYAGSQGGIAVNPAAAATFSVGGFPSPTTAGVAWTFTVTAHDAYGNVASGYRGTIHFTSSDKHAVLPPNYTFVSGDSGVHTFTVRLHSGGTSSITATDAVDGSIKGSTNVTVG